MSINDKAKVILKEIDEVFTIPGYMEKYVNDAIVRALLKIKKGQECGE